MTSVHSNTNPQFLSLLLSILKTKRDWSPLEDQLIFVVVAANVNSARSGGCKREVGGLAATAKTSTGERRRSKSCDLKEERG
ncbi:hypothetical protein L596_017756 [Steinernema carpocapsae]|uniref:Uncharacterized protein n=1 Tax=Steinernema carpocapsae TaxID=34508 RepID=A0A4V6A1V1_STECR|nr:hypothetical protein L596_017756 [Steinernema carpocapsae]